MFEAMTYEAMLEDVLNNAPKGIDTRQGSIFFDSVSGILVKIAKLYTDLDYVLSQSQADTATDVWLDGKAGEDGVTRHAATPARYSVEFQGVQPAVGERFFSDGLYFTLKHTEEMGYFLEAEVSGTSYNEVYAGTAAIPVNNIAGLEAATFGEALEYGTDPEDDESLRARMQEKASGPAENGNNQHYKTWCESQDGVGMARIIPLWNGPNTVKGVLISPEGKPCGPATVSKVQAYVDPATRGYTAEVDGVVYVVGDGLGEGAANLGAHFTAASAKEVPLSISFDAELRHEATADSAHDEVMEAVEEYLKNLVMDATDPSEVIVRISAIGAVLSGLSSILDYQNLKINGDTANIAPGVDFVPVLQEVNLNVV